MNNCAYKLAFRKSQNQTHDLIQCKNVSKSIMPSWFLTRISKNNESADGSHKPIQEREKFLLNSHFVTADLWFTNKFHTSTLQESKTGGEKKPAYAAPHTVLTFEHITLQVCFTCTSLLYCRDEIPGIHQLLIKCQWRAPRKSLMLKKTW